MRDRYTAEPLPGFGICVYTIADGPLLYCQCFPSIGEDLQQAYVTHVTWLARGPTYITQCAARDRYRFFYAPDVLTLKCLIEEACNNWMDKCSQKQS